MPVSTRPSQYFLALAGMLFTAGFAVCPAVAQAGFPSAVPDASSSQAANSQTSGSQTTAPPQTTESGIAPAPAPPPPSPPQLRLGPADLLEISVYNVPELSQKGRVSNGGDIYFPLIDIVHVDGLTPEEAQTAIEKKLSDGGFVKNPHVVVLVTESSTSSVSLLGEVAKPGSYSVLGERRLMDVISAAGGFTDKSGGTVTITHRNDPTHTVTVRLPSDASPANAGNVVVQPGDTVMVQRGPTVYVVGDVGKPSGFVSDTDDVTVLKAVALAGGPNKTAALSGCTILRKTPTGTEQIKIPLKQILRAKAQDVRMQSGDILFVPSSTRKVVVARSAEALTQMATALSLVAVRP